MGLVPHDQLVNDGAPFVAAFESMFSGWAWAGKFVALVAVILYIDLRARHEGLTSDQLGSQLDAGQ